ncbi:hypothetical protein QF044_003052 [Chryseobacterium sp. W4I1]|nr:hypothetical protein [Chryseobacterium sp. W4I1]
MPQTAKVTRQKVMLLTTECLITKIKSAEPAMPVGAECLE